jgi:hypothetical protein
MLAFEGTVDIALTRPSNKSLLSYEDGGPVDFLQVFNQAHKIGTWEYVIDRQHVFWSPEVYEIHDIEPGTSPVAVARAVRFYYAEDAKRIAETMTKAIQLMSGFKCKLRLMRADGVFRMTESIGAPVLSKAGKVTKLIGTFRDVTTQTEFENTRVGQQDLLIRMIRCLPVAAALIDTKARYIAWSGGWLSDFNLPDQTSYLGQSHFDTLPDIAEFNRKHLEVAFRGTPIGKDNDRIERSTGVSHIVDWRIQPWRDKTGAVGGAMILMHIKYTGAPRMRPESFAKIEQSPLNSMIKLLSDRTSS